MKTRGCFGSVVVLALVVGGVGAGALVVGLGLEIAGRAVHPFTDSPAVGWGAVGLIVGAGAGASVGLRRAGRRSSGLVWVAVGVLLAAMLALGWARASDEIVSSLETELNGRYVTVETENLNVRPLPSLDNTPITTVPWGYRMRELDRADGWVRVVFTQDGETIQGWVSAELVSD